MNARHEKVLVALLTSPNKTEAAKKAGCSTETVDRYLKEESFLQAYRDGLKSITEEATRQVQKEFSPAIDILSTIAKNTEESSGIRIQACRSILEYGMRMVEINDILQTLEVLEGRVKNEIQQ